MDSTDLPTPAPMFDGASVIVAGAGTAGASAARYLLSTGARVTVVDDRFADDPLPPVGVELAGAGARCLGMDALLADASALDAVATVIVSPGFRPTHPLVERAADLGVPVWGEVELAWQLDRAGELGPPRTWLVITGTNGKTTTTSMVESIVAADGRSVAACGNIGLPALDAMAQTPRADVLAVEMSSFQLHWAPSVAPDAGVVLNIAEDHLDWHGSFDAYARAKAGALRGAVAIVGLDDPTASSLPVQPSTRRVGFTLGVPAAGDLGVVDSELVDDAFGAGSLIPTDRIRPAGPSGCADALAAAALTLAIGVSADAVAAGLSAFEPAAHRGEVVAVCDGIDFVDDSKATNPHAAQAAIRGRRRVVLIAGGQLKGASVDGMIIAERSRLAGVVAIGVDRELIIDAITRHAPEVPRVTVFTGDDGSVILTPEQAMDEAVRAAWALVAADRAAGNSPDAVLLAPAAASLDMFRGYGVRGERFAESALRLPGASTPTITSAP